MLRSFLSMLKYRRNPNVVLMYHRIANADTDPWDLAVSPQHFEEHLQVLKNYNVVSLEELEWIIAEKSPPKRATVAITFDDGYIDNYQNAKPLLEKYQMPASFFIATQSITEQEEFWWDALERICFHSGLLPKRLSLDYPEAIDWKIGDQDLAGGEVIDPLSLYFKLCELTRKLPAKEQDQLIDNLKFWASNFRSRDSYLAMKEHHLKELDSSPLFSLGAHTATHPFLPDFSFLYQKDDIENGIKFLENLTGKKVGYFAYPHGGHNELTLKIMAMLDLKLAFTTERGNFNSSNPYTIPRLQVKNWSTKEFATELKSVV